MSSLAGKPLILWAVKIALDADFASVTVVLGVDRERIGALLGDLGTRV